MKTPPLTAAIKRLRTYAEWLRGSRRGSFPYEEHPERYSLDRDLNLLLRAVAMLDDKAYHTDNHDLVPIFQLAPNCLWTNAETKGLLHCLGVALVNEDAKEGATFK